jgi:histidine triad (HIT) family protein
VTVDPNCPFCKIVAGEIPADRVYEDERLVAFKDIHPQAPVHLLIIPKSHIATLDELAAEDRGLAGDLLLTAHRLAAERSLPGYRVTMNVNKEGGQVIFHAHLHLLGGRQMKGGLG